MVERGRTFIAQKPSNLGQTETRLVKVLRGQAAPQAVDDLGEIRAFFSEPPCKRSRADRQRLGDDSGLSAAMRQQSLNLVLNRGPHGPLGSIARPRRLLAEWPQCLQKMRIFGDEPKREGLR